LNLNPNGIFHVSFFVHFCEAFMGIKPHWILFWKFFRVKAQPSAKDSRVVRGAGILMREDATDQYLSHKLIDSNQDWKAKWFYVTNQHRSCQRPAESSRSIERGGTPSRRCRKVSNYPSCCRRLRL
jgi:hypothetical protein